MKERELKNTAYHEAGHAIIAHVLPHLDPVQLISVIPSGRALGYTLNPPVEDKYSVYREEMKQDIAMLLGGRVAEELIYGDFSGGASNDIERATAKARYMVKKLGMSDVIGPINYGNDGDEVFLGRSFSSQPTYSDKLSALIDEEVHKIITDEYARAKKILTENIDKLHFIADYLVKHETMDADQFVAVMDNNATEDELIAIAEEKAKKSREANEKQAEKEREAQRDAERNARDEANGKKTDNDGLDSDGDGNRYSNDGGVSH
jgi:cell division protease FtsH